MRPDATVIGNGVHADRFARAGAHSSGASWRARDTLFDHRPYRERVLALADELGLHPEILGPVPDDDLPGLMAGAAAFAFPSTKEGFGLAAMEALAAGVPLVTRDLPVLREVFGEAARFATDPGSPRHCSTRPAGRTRCGNGPAAAHSWTTAAARHADLYARFLTG